MKKTILSNIVFQTITLISLGQLTQPTNAQPGVSPYYKAPTSYSGKTVVVPAGTTLEGLIDRTIGSSVSKQGSSFTISVSSPLLANGSDVLIPAGAIIVGQVVQAIPAKDVPHAKKEKPTGKLRVQITTLQMPDGMAYPMVASLVGEDAVRNPRMFNQFNINNNPVRGSGVAYVGTPSGFEAVAPGKARYNSRTGVTQVITKNEMLSDPIMGRGYVNLEKTSMRSLVKKNRNLYIYNGSPLTIRLEAPFKIGIGSSAGEESALRLHSSELRPGSPQNNPQGNQPTATPPQPNTYSPSGNSPQKNNQESNF